ncbi:hypothetical protein JCM10213_001384 [Rhodosporidiobolus nylandii]
MVKEIVELDKPLAYVLGTQPFHHLPVELSLLARSRDCDKGQSNPHICLPDALLKFYAKRPPYIHISLRNSPLWVV